MSSSIPSTQQAVVLPGKRKPFTSQTVPVYPPTPGQVLVRVAWTSSTPLDLHRADGGLLIPEYPSQMGSGGAAGRIVAVGDGGDLKGLAVGDRVVAFAFHGGKESNHQEYITIPSYLASKIPDGISYQEAVTVSVNLITVFHTMTYDLKLELPWPVPKNYTPEQADQPVLIWGASSSVGIYALQVFKHWGFRNLIAVASEKQHDYLRSIGATQTFDYRKDDVVDHILKYISDIPEPRLPYIIDCIGSLKGTLKPLSKLARRGSIVAVMLPVILKDATVEEEPEYEMDVSKVLVGQWADGVEVRGVRTHFYLSNEFLKEKAQPEIVPALLRDGIITPNRYRVVEGSTVVERAQKAVDILRNKEVSGERLVWKIAEDERHEGQNPNNNFINPGEVKSGEADEFGHLDQDSDGNNEDENIKLEDDSMELDDEEIEIEEDWYGKINEMEAVLARCKSARREVNYVARCRREKIDFPS
ncbi:zinc-dependent oxidoreductase [Fusarium heterosporum]|uniref:Zinc-dependent oxidoreductase n=1 Tax=Fusarium heterosporum TaxID=42747 RepID=A0A8H5TR85_FUSHE|nr:zinc-dependent oxidoreductase [Fusarium heterosporum]